jgi:hypothetical protein
VIRTGCWCAMETGWQVVRADRCPTTCCSGLYARPDGLGHWSAAPLVHSANKNTADAGTATGRQGAPARAWRRLLCRPHPPAPRRRLAYLTRWCSFRKPTPIFMALLLLRVRACAARPGLPLLHTERAMAPGMERSHGRVATE